MDALQCVAVPCSAARRRTEPQRKAPQSAWTNERLLKFACMPCCQVGRHLPKLFDSLAKLRFEDDEDEAEADARQASETSVDSGDVKDAVGMRSKDGEYVALSQTCNCSGQVHRPVIVYHDFRFSSLI